MVTKKVRRHSGRFTNSLNKPMDMKYNKMKEECLEPQESYDDWNDYRDGQRDTPYLEWKKRDKKKRIKQKRW